MKKVIYLVLMTLLLSTSMLFAKDVYADNALGNLAVIVIDKNNFNRIQGATVTIVDGPYCQNVGTAFTDSSGTATFSNLIQGTYQVKIDANNYATEISSAVSSAGGSNDEVYLNPTSTQKLTLSVDPGGSVTFISGFTTTPTFSNGITQTFAIPLGTHIILQASPFIPHSSCGATSETHFNGWTGVPSSQDPEISFSMNSDMTLGANFGQGYGLASPSTPNSGSQSTLSQTSLSDKAQVTNAPKLQGNTPISISSVTQITTNTHSLIYVEGNGFGNTFPQTTQLPDGSVLTQGCNVNTPSIAILDNGVNHDKWPAGWYCDKVYPGGIGLYIAKWSDTEIVLNGFGSTLGTSNQKLWNISTGDPITIAIFGPNQMGKTIYQLTVSEPSSQIANSPTEPAPIMNSGGSANSNLSNPQSQSSYNVTFAESGLQQSCWFWIFGCSLPHWSITLDGNTQTSTSTSITFDSVQSRTNSYSVITPSGYSVQSGQLQVNGDVTLPITFIKNP